MDKNTLAKALYAKTKARRGGGEWDKLPAAMQTNYVELAEDALAIMSAGASTDPPKEPVNS